MSSVVAFLLLLTTAAFGQETTGNIEGTVKDPQGNVVTGATVTVTSAGSRTGAPRTDATGAFTRTVTTNAEGFFRVVQVPPGFYSVQVAPISGFGAAELSGIEVVLGKTTPVEVSLGATGVQESVTVSADAIAIDPTDNKIQTNITARMAELLPKGTNFTSLLTVSPAVRNEPLTGGFQIDGASGSENTFIIDGQEVTNFRTGTLNTNNNIPFQFVQEVQVKSSGFEAEFGGATGGVVNVVTKSGSNDWHGEFGMQFTVPELQAGPRQFLTNAFGTARHYRPKRDGGTDFFPTANLSGPIIKDRVWFFSSYSPQIFSSTRVLNYFNPITGAPFDSQTYRASTRREYLFNRIDASILDNLRFSGSWTWNPIINDGLLDPFANELAPSVPTATFPSGEVRRGAAYLGQQGGRENSQNTSGQLTWTPTANLVVSARGGYSFLNEKGTSYGNPPVAGGSRILCSSSSLVGSIPAEFGCVRGQSNRPVVDELLFDVSRRRTLDLDATYLTNFGGRHQFKGGYQINALSNDVLSETLPQVVLYFGRTIQFPSGRSAADLPPSPGTVGAGLIQVFSEQGSASSKNQAFYFQDSWQPTRRISLNLGIRAEKENVPSFIPGRPSITLNYMDKIAPRLGFALDLTGDGRTKLFASYGWFYDRFKYELPRGSFGGNFFHRFYFEIFPGDAPASRMTPQYLTAGYTPVLGGACPAPGGTRIRCDDDFRIASNAGLPVDIGGGIDPDLKPFRQSEFTVGMERDLGSGYLLSGRFTHKQVDQTIEDIGFHNEEGSEIYIIGNPGRGLAKEIYDSFGFASPPAERNYDALEVRLDKRFTDRYYFNVNYTYSRLFGNYSGLASSDEDGRTSPNVSRYFDQPFSAFTANAQPDNGRLPTDRPHVVKAAGGYTLDWNDQFGRGAGNSTEFSAFTTMQSGTPLTTRFTFQSYDSIILDRRGDLGRTEAFTQTDFGIRHRYRFGSNERLTMVFDLDILNLFNESNQLTVFDNISSFNFDGSEIGLSGDSVNAGGEFQRIPTLSAIREILNADNGELLDERYGLTTGYQGGRSVRFGFRLLF